MKSTLEHLVEERNNLRVQRAELLRQMNDWELAGRDLTELEADYETMMAKLRAVNAEINTYKI